MKIKYTSKHCVHAISAEGNVITLYHNCIYDLKELPKQGVEYCVILDAPKPEVEKKKAKKKSKKVIENGS